jgi:hypothetical protein
MIQYLLIFTLISSVNDTMTQIETDVQKSYGKQILISSIIGFSFTLGMGYFYMKGNDAYEEYKQSETMKAALDNWDRVQLYDNIRNVCAVGAVIFLGRAIYYQFRSVSESSSSSYKPLHNVQPVIELKYNYQPKVILGVSMNL